MLSPITIAIATPGVRVARISSRTLASSAAVSRGDGRVAQAAITGSITGVIEAAGTLLDRPVPNGSVAAAAVPVVAAIRALEGREGRPMATTEADVAPTTAKPTATLANLRSERATGMGTTGGLERGGTHSHSTTLPSGVAAPVSVASPDRSRRFEPVYVSAPERALAGAPFGGPTRARVGGELDLHWVVERDRRVRIGSGGEAVGRRACRGVRWGDDTVRRRGDRLAPAAAPPPSRDHLTPV